MIVRGRKNTPAIGVGQYQCLGDSRESDIIPAQRDGHDIDRAIADDLRHLVDLGRHRPFLVVCRLSGKGLKAIEASIIAAGIFAQRALADRGAGGGHKDERHRAAGIRLLERQRQLGGSGRGAAMAQIMVSSLLGLQIVGRRIGRHVAHGCPPRRFIADARYVGIPFAG
jgi:hypothetical protein